MMSTEVFGSARTECEANSLNKAFFWFFREIDLALVKLTEMPGD
jgi:hypothetical protein